MASRKRPRDENDEDDEDDEDFVGEFSQEKIETIRHLQENSIQVERAPILPFLTVEQIMRAPFKCPCPQVRTKKSEILVKKKTLGASWKRMKFIVPKTFKRPDATFTGEELPELDEEAAAVILEEKRKEPAFVLPPDFEPCVLWQPAEGEEGTPVVVDPFIARFLRDHQREGVKFTFECACGLRDFEGNGCILADDMGLGKTLQAITLMYTLLRQGMQGKPTVKRVLIVCPTSLVRNWGKEIEKWLGGRVPFIALAESVRDKVIRGINAFVSNRPAETGKPPAEVLILSYECFRIHLDRIMYRGDRVCDLLICDEAHRLKNPKTRTTMSLNSLACRKRILLSGTPMQNDLQEFFAMVDFTNPGVLGDASAFHRTYENPILIGREPDALDSERKLGAERSAALSTLVNQFILRRTNTLLSNHLPPKTVQVVCCKLSPLQRELYMHFCRSKDIKRMMLDGKQSGVLASITALKKLCNHPRLIFDVLSNKYGEGRKARAPGFDEEALVYFGEGFGRMCRRSCLPELGGKFVLLDRMLQRLRAGRAQDRIVIVSNYTQTLDLVTLLCKERSWPVIRLDGSTGAKKRQSLVDELNDPHSGAFVFLLSSKAGGCGLNLIGANRLVLFDPDWNPATDKQAAARVWRDGQKKKVFLYRFLATGTIEEKIFQRQLSKEGLQNIVVEESKDSNSLSTKLLRDLFTLRESTASDTHDRLCRRCFKPAPVPVVEEGEEPPPPPDVEGLEQTGRFAEQDGHPREEDLNLWSHHWDLDTVEDDVLKEAGRGVVSFTFGLQVAGKLLPLEPPKLVPKAKKRRKVLGNCRVRSMSQIKRDSEQLAARKLHEAEVSKEKSERSPWLSSVWSAPSSDTVMAARGRARKGMEVTVEREKAVSRKKVAERLAKKLAKKEAADAKRAAVDASRAAKGKPPIKRKTAAVPSTPASGPADVTSKTPPPSLPPAPAIHSEPVKPLVLVEAPPSEPMPKPKFRGWLGK